MVDLADSDISKLWRDRDIHGRPHSIARALTPGERAVIERRHSELRVGCAAFAPAEQNLAIAAVSRMLGGFRALRHDDEQSAVAGLDGLRHVLAPFPLWAIQAGCSAISRNEALIEGKRLDRRFAPNDAEVAAIVREILKPYLAALRNVAGLLAAPVQCNVESSKPTRAETAGELRRTIPDKKRDEAKSASPARTGDGGHAMRVMVDLAARVARRETRNGGA